MIIDVTASRLRRWPAYADVRVDVSADAHPDVVADARSLPFPDSSFTDLFCDPPFNVYRSGFKRDGYIRAEEDASYVRFSHWETYADWLAFVHATDREFSRVLIPNGALHYKIPDGVRPNGKRDGGRISFRDLALMEHFALLWDERVATRGPFVRTNLARGRSAHPVHYATFLNRKTEPCSKPNETIASEGGL